MTSQAIKKYTNLLIQSSQNKTKHFIFFLWGFFGGICFYKIEWPIPLQGTVFKISTSNKLPASFAKDPDSKDSMVKVACLVSPQIIKYIDQRQEVSFQADALGNIQKNKRWC